MHGLDTFHRVSFGTTWYVCKITAFDIDFKGTDENSRILDEISKALRIISFRNNSLLKNCALLTPTWGLLKVEYR